MVKDEEADSGSLDDARKALAQRNLAPKKKPQPEPKPSGKGKGRWKQEPEEPAPKIRKDIEREQQEVLEERKRQEREFMQSEGAKKQQEARPADEAVQPLGQHRRPLGRHRSDAIRLRRASSIEIMTNFIDFHESEVSLMTLYRVRSVFNDTI